MIVNISGADVRTPRKAQSFLTSLAAVYGELVASLDQFLANQRQDGVSGEPLRFLSSMRDQSAVASAAMTAGARRAAQHAAKFGDTWSADPSLAGTQSGGYGDAKKL